MIYGNNILGINTFEIEQGTEEWKRSRLGVISASNAEILLMEDARAPLPEDIKIIEGSKRGENIVIFQGKEFIGTKAKCIDFVRDSLPRTPSIMKENYMLDLVGEICRGKPRENTSFKQAEWGHLWEPVAREAYEALKFERVEQCGFIYKDESLRVGCSPDGLTDLCGLEIKNPVTDSVHLRAKLKGEIKPEYDIQCQFSMYVTGYQNWDFCSYHNEFRGCADNRLVVIPQYPRDEIFRKLEDAIPKFISEMDAILEIMGFKYGDQWLDVS